MLVAVAFFATDACVEASGLGSVCIARRIWTLADQAFRSHRRNVGEDATATPMSCEPFAFPETQRFRA